ncbi:hypothetical protein V6N12_055383 [Hibiscus sabdariffa]|uniref:Uncharacterized protein n=1 Tax=Hibiscus sabdariffa TaxID=183260 RepID=A0ABR2AW95_9ROSI
MVEQNTEQDMKEEEKLKKYLTLIVVHGEACEATWTERQSECEIYKVDFLVPEKSIIGLYRFSIRRLSSSQLLHVSAGASFPLPTALSWDDNKC